MVCPMACDDECERTHCERISVGDAASRPGVRRKIPEEGKSGEPYISELLNVGRPGNVIGLRTCSRDVLIVTR